MGGISPSVTKEELEAEFRKFGKIEDFKFLRERNTAFVEYFNLDDATQAMKMMNGKRIGGDQIRVDFLRSHSSKKVSICFIMLIWFIPLPLHFLLDYLFYYTHTVVSMLHLCSTFDVVNGRWFG